MRGRRFRPRLAALLALAPIILGLTAAAPANADTAYCAAAKGDDPMQPGMTQDSKVVILVHGWTGTPDSMNPVASGLKTRLKDPTVTFLRFDYAADSSHWAAVPAIADCFAQYVNRVTYHLAGLGADRRVLVVAHSMGGLATRFATGGEYSSNPLDHEIAGVVTLDTPYLGSPFGNQFIARAKELKLRDPTTWPTPPPGTDGSVCLALHNSTTGLPDHCKTAPYLPEGTPVTQIGGNISLRRSLFGIDFYDIDLGSDGIVGVDSELGYVGSGPIGGRTPKGQRTIRRVDCTLGLPQVLDGARALNLIAKPDWNEFLSFLSSLGTQAYSDDAAMKQLAYGSYGPSGPHLAQLLIAANLKAACSHINILGDGPALDEAAAALKGYLKQMAASSPNRPEIKPFVGGWHRHRTALAISTDGSVFESGDDYIASKVAPAGTGLAGTIESADHPSPEYGIYVGSPLVIQPGPTSATIRVLYGNGPAMSLEFCRDGVPAPPGNECGA